MKKMIKTAGVVGKNTNDSWSGVIDTSIDGVHLMATIALSGENVESVGKLLLERISRTSLRTAEDCYQMVLELSFQAHSFHTSLFLACAFEFKTFVCYSTYNGSIFLRRNKNSGTLIETGSNVGFVKGNWFESDVVLMSTLPALGLVATVKEHLSRGFAVYSLPKAMNVTLRSLQNSSLASVLFLADEVFKIQVANYLPIARFGRRSTGLIERRDRDFSNPASFDSADSTNSTDSFDSTNSADSFDLTNSTDSTNFANPNDSANFTNPANDDSRGIDRIGDGRSIIGGNGNVAVGDDSKVASIDNDNVSATMAGARDQVRYLDSKLKNVFNDIFTSKLITMSRDRFIHLSKDKFTNISKIRFIDILKNKFGYILKNRSASATANDQRNVSPSDRHNVSSSNQRNVSPSNYEQSFSQSKLSGLKKEFGAESRAVFPINKSQNIAVDSERNHEINIKQNFDGDKKQNREVNKSQNIIADKSKSLFQSLYSFVRAFLSFAWPITKQGSIYIFEQIKNTLQGETKRQRVVRSISEDQKYRNSAKILLFFIIIVLVSGIYVLVRNNQKTAQLVLARERLNAAQARLEQIQDQAIISSALALNSLPALAGELEQIKTQLDPKDLDQLSSLQEKINNFQVLLEQEVQATQMPIIVDYQSLNLSEVSSFDASDQFALLYSASDRSIVSVNIATNQSTNLTLPARVDAIDVINDKAYIIMDGIWMLDLASDTLLPVKIRNKGNSNTNANIIKMYANSAYVFNPLERQIYRYVAQSPTSYGQPVEWFNDNSQLNFEDIVDMVVDTEIWLSTKNGEILRFSAGKKQEFSVSDDILQSSLLLTIDPSSKTLFILEPSSSSLYSVDKLGNLELIKTDDLFSSAIGISLDQERKQLLIGLENKAIMYQLP